eukprot:g6792.t2
MDKTIPAVVLGAAAGALAGVSLVLWQTKRPAKKPARSMRRASDWMKGVRNRPWIGLLRGGIRAARPDQLRVTIPKIEVESGTFGQKHSVYVTQVTAFGLTNLSRHTFEASRNRESASEDKKPRNSPSPGFASESWVVRSSDYPTSTPGNCTALAALAAMDKSFPAAVALGAAAGALAGVGLVLWQTKKPTKKPVDPSVMNRLRQSLVDASQAAAMVQALVEGGLTCVEVVFRTACAEEAVRRMVEAEPRALVGAGTILTPQQAERAVQAGARFIVSPGLNPEVVHWCHAHGVVVIPGVATPTEVETAMRLGLEVLKFFPAEANGGVAALKAIGGPYSKLTFMPTGGVNESNLEKYLSLPQVACCGGSWMLPQDVVAQGDWRKIKSFAQEAFQLAQSIKRKGKKVSTRCIALTRCPVPPKIYMPKDSTARATRVHEERRGRLEILLQQLCEQPEILSDGEEQLMRFLNMPKAAAAAIRFVLHTSQQWLQRLYEATAESEGLRALKDPAALLMVLQAESIWESKRLACELLARRYRAGVETESTSSSIRSSQVKVLLRFRKRGATK